MNQRKLRSLLLLALEVAAVGIIVFSFTDWMRLSVDMEFYRRAALSDVFQGQPPPDVRISGGDVAAVSGNDGLISFILALAIFLTALANRFLQSYILSSITFGAAILIVVLMVYIVADAWPGSTFPDGFRRTTAYTWQFWALMGLALFCSIAGFAMLFAHKPDLQTSETEEIAWA